MAEASSSRSQTLPLEPAAASPMQRQGSTYLREWLRPPLLLCNKPVWSLRWRYALCCARALLATEHGRLGEEGCVSVVATLDRQGLCMFMHKKRRR